MDEKWTQVSESEVIKKCQEGDREAFRFLVEWYRDILYGTAFLMTRDKVVTEDQVQEAFISAWKNIRSFHLGSPMKPWIVRILVNKVLSYRRNNSIAFTSLNANLIIETATCDATEDVERHEQLEQALNHLSEEQRQVILLRYFTGLSLEETSSVLGRLPGTIKSQTHRALEQLKYSINR